MAGSRFPQKLYRKMARSYFPQKLYGKMPRSGLVLVQPRSGRHRPRSTFVLQASFSLVLGRHRPRSTLVLVAAGLVLLSF